jgi:hypothetical protein
VTATGVTVAPGPVERSRWSRSLPATAGASLGLMIGGLLVSGLTGGVFPSPYDDAGVIADYFAQQSPAVRLQSPFMLASAAALAGYAALISARLRQAGQVARSHLSLTAGVLSAGMLALSGLLTWVLARGGERTPAPDLRTVHDLTFVTGGVCHVLFLALMIGSVSMACRHGRLLTTAMTAVGAAIGVLGVIALASLLVPALSVLLPLVRFPGLVWMTVAGVLILRRDRAGD